MLVTDKPDYVASWVCAQRGAGAPRPIYAVGFSYEDELVAGVYFDAMTDNNVFAHIASAAPVLPKSLLMAVALWVYNDQELDRMTFAVPSDNEKTVLLVHGMGAEYEGRLRNACGNGNDLLMFALWRDAPFTQRILKLTEH